MKQSDKVKGLPLDEEIGHFLNPPDHLPGIEHINLAVILIDKENSQKEQHTGNMFKELILLDQVCIIDIHLYQENPQHNIIHPNHQIPRQLIVHIQNKKILKKWLYLQSGRLLVDVLT